MHSEKLQAFVLTARDYGESDRIVSLFTLEHGRIRTFARRAKNSRKRFGAALESFARIEAHVRLKAGLSGLQQAELQRMYPRLRADLAGIAHALYACELVDAMTPEGHPLPRLFRLLTAFLDRLELSGAREPERRFFEINLLNVLGYRPSLESCVRCGSPFAARSALLLNGAELACHACAGQGRPLSPGALQRLRACLETGSFGLIDFPDETLTQAGLLLDEALAIHAGRQLRSLEFLQLVAT